MGNADLVHPCNFIPSEPLTLGIEEEFLLLPDGVHDPTDSLIERLLGPSLQPAAVPGGWIKAELLTSTAEIATAPATTLEQLDIDLHAVRAELCTRANMAEMGVAGLGLHPTLLATRDDVTPTPDHLELAELFTRVDMLADQVTCGIHVHVGVPDLPSAIAVMNSLAAISPLLTACTAHSPVHAGHRTAWMSTRTHLLHRIPWGGPTPAIPTAAAYEQAHALHQLENPAEQRFTWEVAPVPRYGTVELRTADAHHDPRVALGIAALAQSIAAHTLDGSHIARQPESLERHNRWSAMEFGPRAQFLALGYTTPIPVAELLHTTVEMVRPCAADLGCAPWLAIFDELIETPPCTAAAHAFARGGASGLLTYATITHRDTHPD